MSDLTTLATLTRVIGRVRTRLGEMSQWDVDPTTVLDLLLEELHEEMKPRPPDRWGEPT